VNAESGKLTARRAWAPGPDIQPLRQAASVKMFRDSLGAHFTGFSRLRIADLSLSAPEPNSQPGPRAAIQGDMRPAFAALMMMFAVGCSQPSKSPAEVRVTDHARAAEELADAAQVVQEMNQISAKQRERARCVAVVPSLLRAGFIVGGRHGDGLVSCRTSSGWSAPAFITVTGGSAGFQIGVESSDVVMLLMTDRAMAPLFRSHFAIGADLSASAGPVGEAAEGATDASMRAEILSYARSRGLFAGAELSGVVVKQDMDALVAMYGANPDPHAILAGDIAIPRESGGFVAALGSAFGPGPVGGAK